MKLKYTIALALSISMGFTQEVAVKKPNLREIFDALESGECEKAYSKILEAMAVPELSEDSRSKLVGLRITALAQLFIDSKISYEELKVRTKEIPLGPIYLIGHRFSERGGLSFLTPQKENPAELFLADSNKTGTYIFGMFRIKAKADSPFKPVEGSVYFVQGNLASLECHPYGRGSYVFRVTIDGATLVGK